MYLQFIDCVIDASSFFIVVDTFVTNVRINDDIMKQILIFSFILLMFFIFIIIFIENNFLLTSPIFILKYSIAIILVLS